MKFRKRNRSKCSYRYILDPIAHEALCKEAAALEVRKNNNMNSSASWNASSWLGVTKPQQASLKKTIQSYKALSHRLKGKLEQLMQKREELNSRAFVMVHEIEVPSIQSAEVETATHTQSPGPLDTIPHIPQTRMEALDDYHTGDLSSLASTVTSILIESVEIRLSYVMEAIEYLTILYNEDPKQPTPKKLMLSHYEEWVDTNQRLFELNSRLYDLEKMKFDLQRESGEQGGSLTSLQDTSREEISRAGEQWEVGVA